MSAPLKGVLAGLIGTAAMSLCLILCRSFAIVPEVDLIQMLGKMGGNPPAGAWSTHFIVGSMLWGFLYAGFAAVMPGHPAFRGAVFGVIAWFAMMTLFMPVANLGMFGMGAGIGAPLLMLAAELVFGIATALAYDAISRTWPERDIQAEEDAEQDVLRQLAATEGSASGKGGAA